MNDPNYLNWVRVGLALRETTKGLGEYAERHAKELL